MRTRQWLLLGVGLLLGVLALLSSITRRALEAPPQAGSASKAEPRGPESIEVGGFRLRGEVGGKAVLLGSGDQIIVELKALADAQVAPGVTLFGHPVVQLTDQLCPEPCPFTSIVVARMSEGGGVVFSGPGRAVLRRLERNGVPVLMLEYRMASAKEEVTLPFALRVDRYEPAYRRYPAGVDRQLENLARASATDCQSPTSGVCAGELRALLALAMFAHEDLDPAPVLDAASFTPEVRLRLEDAELRGAVKAELEMVLNR